MKVKEPDYSVEAQLLLSFFHTVVSIAKIGFLVALSFYLIKAESWLPSLLFGVYLLLALLQEALKNSIKE